MNKNIKSIFFVLTIISLLVAVSAVNAADNTTDNSVSDMVTSTSTSSQLATQEVVQTSSDNNIENTENNIIKKESKNLKNNPPTDHTVNDDEDWDSLFTSTGLASNVNEGDNIVFGGDVTTTGTSYIIDKPININGNNHELHITTSSNSKQSLNFISTAAGSNITDLKFYNTQVFVNTSQNIVFDNITAVNSQTGLGQGTGSFAIRDGSINITVKNSDFITTSNGGYSTLVLTWAKDCIIDNNNITGTGNVGNLVYLNNYGGNTNANGITNNSHNTISNNNITATNNGIFCYSVSLSGANNTILNNNISNSYTYAVTTIWAGSYDTETDPEDTHNVSYHGNKYINNNITGKFSTGNYSEVNNNIINGVSIIVGHANVTGNKFLNTVNLSNDICFKENNASTVTVNVNLSNCHLKDNNISVVNILTVANPTYNCGGNIIGTTNGNFQSCNCGGTCCQSGNNAQVLIKTTNTLKSANPSTQNVEYYYGTYIDDNTWEVNITEDNFSEVLPTGIFKTAVIREDDSKRNWFTNLKGKNVILNIYYLPSNQTFSCEGSANVTVHFMGNVSINNELYTSSLKSNYNFYSDGNITINCDEDYFWVEYDELGYISQAHGFDLLKFTGNSTVKNLVYNINISEDQLDVINLNYDNHYCAVNGDNLTLEDCTFNIQLPRNIKTYSNGWDTVNYSVQLLGSDTLQDHSPRSGNFTIINCTFNINSLAENEDEYPYFFTNLGLADNQTVIFKGNTFNLNNVRGIQLATDNGIIENNTINTNYDYAVELIGNNNAVQNNVLIAKEYKGNDAVLITGENNVVQNNEPIEKQPEPTLIIETIEFAANTNTTISASIFSGEEKMENITKGKVTFKVDGKTLKDTSGKVIYAKVINGTATIENYLIPDSWKEGSTIQAVYSGSTECEKLTSEKENITINKEEPTFITESVTAKAGDKITLKAKITDNGNVINTGKVVFKINGKTVKDENGKVIYAKVLNNIVNVEYTIPDSFNVKDYNITAVFIAPGYDSLENTKTLTITE